MKIWDKIKGWLKYLLKIQTITPSGVIRLLDVKEVLEEVGISKFEITDTSYYTSLVSDMQEFLNINISRIKKYQANIYDCDNFSHVFFGEASLLLSGYAVGIVHVKTKEGLHALNFMITKDKKFFYIEPQDNTIFNFSRGNQKGYTPYFALI